MAFQSPLLENSLFWIFAALAVVGAFGVVFHRSIIYAALFLIVVFLSIAGTFVLNNADFLAITQTIVYGVGLTIVMLFGVMFTGDKLVGVQPVPRSRQLAYGLVMLMSFALLLTVGVSHLYPAKPASLTVIEALAHEGTTRQLGVLLFQDYVLPFELASVLLLLAMIGAIVLCKKQFAHEAHAPRSSVLPFLGKSQATTDESLDGDKTDEAKTPELAQV